MWPPQKTGLLQCRRAPLVSSLPAGLALQPSPTTPGSPLLPFPTWDKKKKGQFTLNLFSHCYIPTINGYFAPVCGCLACLCVFVCVSLQLFCIFLQLCSYILQQQSLQTQASLLIHPCLHLLLVVWNHLLLKEAPHVLPEKIMVLVEDPTSPNVHQGLGIGGLWTVGRGGLSGLLGLTVL